jgi:hypothetical protein
MECLQASVTKNFGKTCYCRFLCVASYYFSLKLALAILFSFMISNQPIFQKKHGRIQISHLILKSLDHNIRSKVLYFWIQHGKTRLNRECGCALSEMKNHIPVFFDHKEGGRCIC